MSSPGMFSFKALFLVRRLEVVGGGGGAGERGGGIQIGILRGENWVVHGGGKNEEMNCNKYLTP